MNVWQLSLLAGACAVSIVCLRLPRAHLWIFAGAAAFVAATAWQRAGLPYHAAFTLSCDSCVCLAIYFLGRERWEIGLFRIFQVSVLTSLVFLAGPITLFGSTLLLSHGVYVIFLELWNWAALLLIGGVGLSEEWAARRSGGRRGGHEDGSSLAWLRGLFRSLRAWRAPRREAPFHKVAG